GGRRRKRPARGAGHGGGGGDARRGRIAGRLRPPMGSRSGSAGGDRRHDAVALAVPVPRCPPSPGGVRAMTAAAFHPHGDPHGHARRRRELVTPEGLSLPLTIASRAARAGALLIDIGLIVIALLGVGLLLALVGMNIFEGADDSARPAVELIAVLMILLLFFSRYGYFLFFELGPRGATPGKRALGIRVAARGGQRLTA